ncbi:MAG: hypothetical protein RRC34_13585 [Lentisphaeria bacterium]|nr:hypothetical protein [Lentisphaeria bacterium]
MTATAALGGEFPLLLHPDGRLKAVLIDQTPVPIETDLVFPAENWERVYSISQKSFHLTGHQSEKAGIEEWRHTGVVENVPVRLTTGIDRQTGGSQLTHTVKTDTPVQLAGVYLRVDMPVSVFAGGSVTVFSPVGEARAVLPPTADPDSHHVLLSAGQRVLLSLPDKDTPLSLTFPPSDSVIVQDNRQWGADSYSILIQLRNGALAAGDSISSSLGVDTAGTWPAETAVITLSERDHPVSFTGFGGNYCFQYDTPATDFTLSKLASGYLRTELDLAAWEPENDNENPDDWAGPEENPIARNPHLQRRLDLYQKLQKQGSPVIASVWTGPEWLFAEPGRGFWTNDRILPAKNVPEFVECVTAYLLFVRRVIGFEPTYFSLNEADLGIRIKLSAEELAALSTRIAAAFKRHQLKTGLLLGDVASPRGLDYVRACRDATPDPAIYTAIAFHTWGGASPDTWRAWAAYSREIGLPLLATEVGMNGSDHTTPWVFNWHDYALNEAALHADVLNHAAVQGTMHWELTPDYAVVTMRDGGVAAHPTRFAQLRHFFNLVPPDSRILLAEVSGNANVKAVALAGGTRKRTEFTLHLINLGGSCEVTLHGIPDSIGALTSVITGMDRQAERGKTTPVKANEIRLRIPGRSLISLTTPGLLDSL